MTVRLGTASERVCDKRCPSGQAWCGRQKCCPPRWHCTNETTGLCKQCWPNEEECGRKCCNRQTSRCCGTAGCCPTSRSCCNTGTAQKCCPAGQKCAVPIAPGDIGVRPGAASICCPPDRHVTSPNICCPPGQVALNRPGLQVGPGLSPYCCPRGQACGSGANLTCCTRSNVVGSQTCCGGACVNTDRDPNNCGSCRNACASGVCNGGVCAFS